MPSNAVRWFEIYVQDMGRAKKFYESVLQLKLEKLNTVEPELWAFPQVKDKMGIAGALVKMEGVLSGGNSTLVYFGCADCSIEAARAVKFGGRIQKKKM